MQRSGVPSNVKRARTVHNQSVDVRGVGRPRTKGPRLELGRLELADGAVLLGQDVDLAGVVLAEAQVGAVVGTAYDRQKGGRLAAAQKCELLHRCLTAQLQLAYWNVEDPPGDHVAEEVVAEQGRRRGSAVDEAADDRDMIDILAVLEMVELSDRGV